MLQLRAIRGVISCIIVLCSVSFSHAQEEQWTEYLGKSFDSVFAAMKSQSALCDTHRLSGDRPVLIASCMPFEFLGKQGILVLRRSPKGIVEACSWIRGEYPGFEAMMQNIESSRKEQLTVAPGDLDQIFSTVFNYYHNKWKGALHATDDGKYLWRPGQLKKKNVEYTMTRTLDYIEFTVTQSKPQKTTKAVPELSGN